MNPIRHGHADTSKVLMVARALNFDGFVIQKESSVAVESNAANPERGFVLVHCLAIRFQRHHSSV